MAYESQYTREVSLPRRSAPTINDQVTMPGDPEFSIGRAGSQEQFPAAAAQARILRNKQQAQRVADLMTQIGVAVPENMQHISETGLPQEEGNLLSSFGKVIDMPRRMINFGIQDVLAGREENRPGGNFRSPTAKDYWDAFLGKDTEVMLNTGHRPSSGSDTVALLGWEEEDDFQGKVLRGIATFGLETLTDPLTYLTFGASALGKKVLARAGDAAATNVVNKAVREGVTEGMHGKFRSIFDDALELHTNELTGKYADEIAEMTALEDFKGLDELADRVMKEADDLAYKDTLGAARDEIVTPLLQRNFGDQAVKDWDEFIPAYAKGGARFALPFTGEKGLSKGWVIPGTQGLGRKLVGDKVRGVSQKIRSISPRYDKVAGVLESVGKNMDIDGALMLGVKKGQITGGQYLAAKDAIANQIAGEQMVVLNTRLNFEKSEMLGHLKAEVPDIDGDVLEDTLNRSVFSFMNGGSNEIMIDGAAISRKSDLYRAAEGYRDYSRTVMKSFWDALEEIAPDLKLGHLKNYMPMGVNKDAMSLVRELAEKGGATSDLLAKVPKGRSAAGAFYLGQLLGAINGGGQMEAALGGTARAMARQKGFSPFVVLNDLSPVVLGDPTELATSAVARRMGVAAKNMQDVDHHIDIVELNDLIEQHVEALAEELGVHIGKRSPRLLSEDPFQAVADYAQDLDNSLRMRNLIKVLEENGLVQRNRRQVDFQGTMADWVTKLSSDPKIVQAIQASDSRLAGKIGQLDPNAPDDVATPEFIRNLHAMEEEARLVRSALNIYDNGALQRHVMDVIDDADPETRVTHAMDVVEAWRQAGTGGPLKLYYDPTTGRWHDSFETLADSYRTEIQNSGLDPDDIMNELSLWGSEQKAMLNRRIAVATIEPDGRMAYDTRLGMRDNGRKAQERAAELAYANGIHQIDFHRGLHEVGAPPQSTDWRMLLPRDVYELDDMAALQATTANFLGVARSGLVPEPHTLHSDLYKKVIEKYRKTLNSRYQPTRTAKRAFERKHLGSAYNATPEQLANVEKGIVVRDADGNWKVELAYDKSLEPRHGNIYTSHRRKGKKAGKATDDELYDEWYLDKVNEGEGVSIHVDTDHRGHKRLRFEIAAGVPITDELKDISVALARRFDNSVDDVQWDLIGKDFFQDRTDHTSRFFPTKSRLNPDDIDDLDVYVMARDEAREALDEANKKGPLSAARVIMQYEQDFGEEFVQGLTNWTKDIVRTEKAAANMWNRLYNMLQQGRIGGEIGENTLFHVADVKGFENMAATLRRNAEKLGIDPKTFEVKYTSSPIRHEGKTFVNPGMFAIGGDALENAMIEKNMAEWMGQLAQNMSSLYTPIGMAQLKASAGQIQRWWKTMTTITRPTFHIRNLLGGTWNNQIIGVGMSDYALVRNNVATMRKALAKGGTWEDALNSIKNPQTREIFDAAFREGILSSSFSNAAFRGMTHADRSLAAKTFGLMNGFDPENFVLARGGGVFMESIEDFMRMSAFVAWYDPKNPVTGKVAAEMAIAAHFDYKNLTKWETNVKHVIPFFVWQRRNIPLQLQTMVERPGLMQRYQHFLNSFDDQFEDVEQDEMGFNQYMHADAIGTDIILNEGTPFWSRLMVDPDIPVKDLYEIMEGDNPFEYFTNGVEYMMNSLGPAYSFVQDVIEQQEYGNVNAPAGMDVVLAQLARMGLYDETVDGDVQVHYLARTVHNFMAPWSQEFADLGLMPQNDPERRLKVGQGQDEGFGERGVAPGSPGELMQRIGMTLGKGLGVKAQTPRDSASQTYQAQEEVRQALNQLFKEQPAFKEFYETQS